VRLSFSRVAERLMSPTADVWDVHDTALARKARGEDVIVLSVGDPDFATPAYISDHTINQIRRGRTHYSPAAGELVMRQAIAELETRLGGREFTADQFVVFPGATAALYGVFACLVDPGGEVIVPEPMYAAYRPLMDALGVIVRPVPLRAPTFDLDPRDLMGAVTPATRAVLVNTPGNPCGNIIPGATLEVLARECLAQGIWLVCDEVYSLVTFDAPHESMLRAAEDLANVIVVDGLSKSHAMSGWRVGWAAASAEVVETLTRFSGSAFFGCCQFVQDGAAYALMHDAPDVGAMRDEYRRRRDYAMRRLDPIGVLGYCRPKAGMFLMIDVTGVCDDGTTFARRLLEDAGVSTLPGACFGDTTAGYVRASLTQPVPVLEAAFDRMERMISCWDAGADRGS
jgi:arginine:pyruvate transaminase